MRRPDLESLSDLVGWDECSGVALVTDLATPPPPGRRGGRPSFHFDGRRIGRGWLGGVGGVLVEPSLQVSDPLLQGGDDGQDGRLGLGRDGGPEGFGDRRVKAHRADSTRLLDKEFEPVNGYLLATRSAIRSRRLVRKSNLFGPAGWPRTSPKHWPPTGGGVTGGNDGDIRVPPGDLRRMVSMAVPQIFSTPPLSPWLDHHHVRYPPTQADAGPYPR